MHEENIELIQSLITKKGDPNTLLSFICDTVDAMRSDIQGIEVTPEFYQATSKILESLKILDREISAGSKEN
ncbi:hypothetical protein A0128_04575 [Leptospira tipperaryensis]|uniref:Uncharacterized protein n=1 Tax=Leptospira tipperaryensis TaxID=2564040 RepID=A0A1D7UUH7_9LEPT|nr:hypothetical protein [Leptospira tipperaryensis]AOP33193.1 hypothetical protein A0128_04575 [Leptospira tipperaryensis]